MVESREVLKESFQTAKPQLRQLWDYLLPGIARDVGDRSLLHDEQKSSDMFEAMVDSPIVTNKGPKMSIGGWMSYFRGTEHWDPYFHRRTFVILVHALKKGLLTGTVGAMNLKIDAVKKMQGSEAPQTKAAKEKTSAELKSIGKNQVHTMAVIHGQGWRLQRSIRLIQEGTRCTERHYNYMHKQCRNEVKTLAFNEKMSGLLPRPEQLCDFSLNIVILV